MAEEWSRELARKYIEEVFAPVEERPLSPRSEQIKRQDKKSNRFLTETNFNF
jgi:hypothetical protein